MRTRSKAEPTRSAMVPSESTLLLQFTLRGTAPTPGIATTAEQDTVSLRRDQLACASPPITQRPPKSPGPPWKLYPILPPANQPLTLLVEGAAVLTAPPTRNDGALMSLLPQPPPPCTPI